MSCAACDHEKSRHGADGKGDCSCGCTGYFVKGADRCLNPLCGNCAAEAAHRAARATPPLLEKLPAETPVK